MWIVAPLLICLPCLATLVLVAVLTGVGIGATGSFLTDNGLLLAIIAVSATLIAIALAFGLRRLLDGRRQHADEHH